MPEIWSAPLLPSAPPATHLISAVDLPPAVESVETDQPDPNFAVVVPSSKLLTKPDSDPVGEGDALAIAISCFSFSTAARASARRVPTPVFQTARMLRVAVMSVDGSPFTRRRSARRPGAI